MLDDRISPRTGGERRLKEFVMTNLAAEDPNIINLSVTSDGTSGPKWIDRLKGSGFNVTLEAEEILGSCHFTATKGKVTEITILKGVVFNFEDLFRIGSAIARKISCVASSRMLRHTDIEVACLIRESFAGDDIRAMGLSSLVTMHKPVDIKHGPLVLSAVDGGNWLHTNSYPCSVWSKKDGFVFASRNR